MADGLRPSQCPNDNLYSYETIVRRHIVPALGKLPLQKLQPMHLQSLYSQKLQGGRADGKPGGLSPRTVRYIHSVIFEALKHAVKWQIVPRNVAEAVEPPRPARQEMQVLTEDQVRKFLATVQDDRFYAAYLLAITTGMRRGEILGLRWQDVDLKQGVVSINQILVRTSSHGLVFQAPKTDRSRRTIAISPTVVQALRQQKKRQAEEKLIFGPDYTDTGLVFTMPEGHCVEPRNLTRQFELRLKKAGLPRVRFHDLRHTHATLLLQKEVHPKVVAERLGHSNINITLDTYSHVIPGMQREAARKIDEALFSDWD